MVEKFINTAYLQKDTLKQIQKSFKQNKELPSVALGEFLTPEGMKHAAKSLKRWRHEAIPDQRSYATCKARLGLGDFIKKISGKSPLDIETILFRQGDYTLLHDTDPQPSGVLAFLFLTDWNSEWGGDIVFMKKGEMLGRIVPQRNTLVVVQRKRNVRMFIKYVNHLAGKNGLVMIAV